MSALKLPMAGGCRCGEVRLRTTKAPILTMACRCTGCQRMTASAFSLSVAIPTNGFAITKGETVTGGLRAAMVQHHFCDSCKTWVFSRMTGADFFVNVRATMFDDASWFTPFVETYTSEKLPWASTPAKHSYEKFPEMGEYEGLMKDYAAKT